MYTRINKVKEECLIPSHYFTWVKLILIIYLYITCGLSQDARTDWNGMAKPPNWHHYSSNHGSKRSLRRLAEPILCAGSKFWPSILAHREKQSPWPLRAIWLALPRYWFSHTTLPICDRHLERDNSSQERLKIWSTGRRKFWTSLSMFKVARQYLLVADTIDFKTSGWWTATWLAKQYNEPVCDQFSCERSLYRFTNQAVGHTTSSSQDIYGDTHSRKFNRKFVKSGGTFPLRVSSQDFSLNRTVKSKASHELAQTRRTERNPILATISDKGWAQLTLMGGLSVWLKRLLDN